MSRGKEGHQGSTEHREDPSGAGFGGGVGEGVLINGMDQQAARRAHMRELTMARQAAERRSLHSLEDPARADRTARAVKKDRARRGRPLV